MLGYVADTTHEAADTFYPGSRHSEVLGGISRLSFQMNAASLPQVKMMRAIDAIGARVAPALRQPLATDSRNQL